MWFDEVLRSALIAVFTGILGFILTLISDFLVRFHARLSEEPIDLKSDYVSLKSIASLLVFVLAFITANVLWSAPWAVRMTTAGVISGVVYLQRQRLKSWFKAANKFIVANKPLLFGALIICGSSIVFTILYISSTRWVPIEAVFWTLVTLYGVIGLIRGWAREMGSTTGIILAMLILARFGDRMIGYANRISSEFLGIAEPVIADAPSFSRFVFFSAVFLAVTFISYHGEAFTLGRGIRTRMQNAMLGLFVGLINGYLIAGNIWYYLHEQGYPLGGDIIRAPISPTAAFIIKLLPPKILTEPLLFGLLVYLLLMRLIS